MTDEHDETPHETPKFVIDEATTADPDEKRSVSPDLGADEPQQRAPGDFEIKDAIVVTSIDPVDANRA